LLAQPTSAEAERCGEEGEEQDPQTERMGQNLIRELGAARPAHAKAYHGQLSNQPDDDTGPWPRPSQILSSMMSGTLQKNLYEAAGAKCLKKAMPAGDMIFIARRWTVTAGY